MSLIIENGSIVPNANSYVTLLEARDFATSRGETLPTDDAVLEALLLKATDYLETKRKDYQASKTDPLNQNLQWPRFEVYIDGSAIPGDFIPKELKQAQIQLAIEQNNGVELLKVVDNSFVKFEKVGPIETEYSEKLSYNGNSSIPSVETLLEPLYSQGLGSSSLKLVRV